jgi:hypothetical protein
MAGPRVTRPRGGPGPDEAYATFERALAREVPKSERLRISMLSGFASRIAQLKEQFGARLLVSDAVGTEMAGASPSPGRRSARWRSRVTRRPSEVDRLA